MATPVIHRIEIFVPTAFTQGQICCLTQTLRTLNSHHPMAASCGPDPGGPAQSAAAHAMMTVAPARKCDPMHCVAARKCQPILLPPAGLPRHSAHPSPRRTALAPGGGGEILDLRRFSADWAFSAPRQECILPEAVVNFASGKRAPTRVA